MTGGVMLKSNEKLKLQQSLWIVRFLVIVHVSLFNPAAGYCLLDWQQTTQGRVETGNYNGLALIDQIMKVVEIVAEDMVRERLDTDMMQFDFLLQGGISEAMFIAQQLVLKFLRKHL